MFSVVFCLFYISVYEFQEHVKDYNLWWYWVGKTPYTGNHIMTVWAEIFRQDRT